MLQYPTDSSSLIRQAQQWDDSFTDSTKLIWGKLMNWIELLISMLPNIVLAAIILFFFYIIAKGNARYSYRVFRRVAGSEAVGQLLTNIASFLLFLLGLSIALSVMALDKAVASILAGAGIIGLALGFAFQDLTVNFISSIIIAVKRPFAMGDLIDSNGYFGTVKQMHFRSIILENTSGQSVILSNRAVLENPLVNYNFTGRRRVDLVIGVSYAENLRQVKELTTQTISELPIVLPNWKIELFFEEFGESSINFVVRFWIQFSRQAEYLEARSEAIMAIHEAFHQNNITIPFPIRTLDFGIKGGKELSTIIKS
ncbi:MAG: mechanosensitive ion channel [Chitinophagales bacterium]